MVKVKYRNTIKPKAYGMRFKTTKSAIEWIETEIRTWCSILCETMPDADIQCWRSESVNRYGMTIYVNGSVCVSCEMVERE